MECKDEGWGFGGFKLGFEDLRTFAALAGSNLKKNLYKDRADGISPSELVLQFLPDGVSGSGCVSTCPVLRATSPKTNREPQNLRQNYQQPNPKHPVIGHPELHEP